MKRPKFATTAEKGGEDENEARHRIPRMGGTARITVQRRRASVGNRTGRQNVG